MLNLLRKKHGSRFVALRSLAAVAWAVGLLASGTAAAADRTTTKAAADQAKSVPAKSASLEGNRPPPAATPGGQGTADAGKDQAAVSAYDNAVNAFKYQDFENAIPQLRALIFPIMRVDAVREAKVREYLGASLWWQGDHQGAQDEFTALLVRNAKARLDPATYPPKMVAEFETLRQNLIGRGELQGEIRPKLPVGPETVAQNPPLVLMFFPFGVGQFANRTPGRGTVFLVGQAVLAGLWDGMYVHNTGPHSKATEITQISASAAFFAVAGWGIVDALVRYGRRSALDGAQNDGGGAEPK